MKKIIFIVFIIITLTKPIYASENSNSPEKLYKEMYSIIDTYKIDQNVVDYSIEIIKNWPESFGLQK